MEASAHTEADSNDGRRRTCPPEIASPPIYDSRSSCLHEVESDDDDDAALVSYRTALRLSTPRPRHGDDRPRAAAVHAAARKRPSHLSDLTVTFDTWAPRAPASGKCEEKAVDFASARSTRQSFS